jgi:2-polyprenyl-6-methoxyphenol hydroxylase-like FAD-dependent oxidoreductase
VPTRHAVILGGGFAGMLAAHVLAEHVEQVTIIERDELPQSPRHRKGVPQGRHIHIFVQGGYSALEELLPGITDELLTHGARHLNHPDSMLYGYHGGWRERRLPSMAGVITSSRALIDWVVRARVLAHPRITVAPVATAVGLLGDKHRVTGVRLRERGGAETRRLPADLVVDATGRSSKTHDWLVEMGLSTPHTERIDAGTRYTTRLYQLPPGTPQTFPLLALQADSRLRPAVVGILTPIEDGQSIVTLVGPEHDAPPTGAEGIEPFLRSLGDPILADLVATATPLGPVHGFAATANRRHYYERARHWPEGLVALGDAYATFNPVYGHGLAVAARTALALRTRWRRHHPLLPGSARRAQRVVARATAQAWRMATSQDLRLAHTTTTGTRPGRLTRLNHAYADRLSAVAPGRPDLLRTQVQILTLTASPLPRLRLRFIWAALRGPRGTFLPEVPLTPEERRILEPTTPVED